MSVWILFAESVVQFWPQTCWILSAQSCGLFILCLFIVCILLKHLYKGHPEGWRIVRQKSKQTKDMMVLQKNGHSMKSTHVCNGSFDAFSDECHLFVCSTISFIGVTEKTDIQWKAPQFAMAHWMHSVINVTCLSVALHLRLLFQPTLWTACCQLTFLSCISGQWTAAAMFNFKATMRPTVASAQGHLQ